MREEYCWLVASGWFVLREKYCWLVSAKPSEQSLYTKQVEMTTVEPTASLILQQAHLISRF
jgi:hypothetical protein